MTPHFIFISILVIISANFVFETWLDYLNAKHFDDPIPAELNDIYDTEAYQKSQDYKRANHKFASIQSTFSFILIVLFIVLNGFKYLEDLVHQLTQNSMLISLYYFGILFLANFIISIPFDYYQNFVIESKFGFNKMTKTLFVTDKIKGLLLTVILGGLVLAIFIWFYHKFSQNFWLYMWIFVTLFSIFMNLFYTSLIVPLFNKLSPVEDDNLKTLLQDFAQKVNFKMDKIFMIDGSKRSSKANAFFAGFGSRKKVVLYDTLLNQLSHEEIVAVLAHEIGHYKKKHILYNMGLSILQTGLVLYILSLFINNPLLAQSLGLQQANFHIGLIVFMFLYTPISIVIGLLMNILSRRFEYQADNFAKQFGYADLLIESLKKLSKMSYGNLTPHWLYVSIHYSHPTILQRFTNLKQKPL